MFTHPPHSIVGSITNGSNVPGSSIDDALSNLYGGTVVDNEAAIPSLSMDDGGVVFVRTFRDFFQYRAASTLPVTASVIITGSGGAGRWERLCIPHPSWIAQTTWEINSNNSCELSGSTPSTAIPYHEFLRRRASVDGAFTVAVGAPVAININADMPANDPLLLRPRLYATLILSGVPTTAYSGTLSAKTDLSTANSGSCPSATATWTVGSLLNKPVKDLTNDRWSWIAKDNGSNTARLNNWVSISETNGTNSTAAAVLNTTVSASIEVYNLTQVHNATIEPQGAARIVVNKLAFPGTVNGMFKAPYQACFQNCDFAGTNRVGAGYYILNNCRLNDQAIAATDQVFFLLSGGLITTGFGNFAYHVGVTLDLCNYVLFQGVSVVIARGGILRLRNVFFEDVSNPIGFNSLMTVQTNAFLSCTPTTIVRGSGHTCNVLRMDSGTRASLGLGANWQTIFSVSTSAHNGIIMNGTAHNTPASASAMCRPIDPATGLPNATPISASFANLQASYGIGTGFGGFMKDTMFDIWAGP